MGQAAHNHGIKHNESDNGGGWPNFEPQAGNSLSVWLKNVGYRTAYIGKYLNGYGSMTVPPGWDKWFAFMSPGYFDYDVNDNGEFVSFDSDAEDYSTDVIAREAIDFLTCPCEQPFFMLVAPYAPHFDQLAGLQEATPAPRHAALLPDLLVPTIEVNPSFNEMDVSDKPTWIQAIPRFGQTVLDPTPFVNERYREAARSLQSVDDLVGMIVAKLEQNGKLANTVICFTSDNGSFYGEHRIVRGKTYGYEPALRVPLVCRGPGIPRGQTRRQIVNNADLTATILDWAGATPGRVIDGKSFAPVIANANAQWRSAVFFDGTFPNCEARKCYSGVRAPTRKYIKWGDGFEELYDLTIDPIENENKAKNPAYAGDLNKLRALHEVAQVLLGRKLLEITLGSRAGCSIF